MKRLYQPPAAVPLDQTKMLLSPRAMTGPPIQNAGDLVRRISSYYESQLVYQKQALEETRLQLENAYRRYTELFDFAPIGFLTLDKKACIAAVNGRAARILGFPATWLDGRPFMVFVAKEHIPIFLDLLVQSRGKSKQHTAQMDLFVNGRTLPVQISMRTKADDDPLTHQMTIIDLTDIRKIETELRESLNDWHNIFHNVPDVIMTIGDDGTILFVNRPVWGFSVQALTGTRVTEHLPPAARPKLKRCIDETFSSGNRTQCEISIGKGQKRCWYGLSFSLSGYEDSSEVTGREGEKRATLMIHDISEHKGNEERLRSSSDQLREFAGRLEDVREEERARIAREIHDQLGQELTVLKLDLSWLEHKIPRRQADFRKKMNSVISSVDNTIDLVRKIVSDLRPSILDDLGLIPAIEWQVSEFQTRAALSCNIHSNVEKLDLLPETSAAVFRVVQEALTNIVRHAEASKVEIRLAKQNGFFKLSIKDDGKGMTAGQKSGSKSLGIMGMKERMARAGARLEIHSRLGEGTRVEIKMPLKIQND